MNNALNNNNNENKTSGGYKPPDVVFRPDRWARYSGNQSSSENSSENSVDNNEPRVDGSYLQQTAASSQQTWEPNFNQEEEKRFQYEPQYPTIPKDQYKPPKKLYLSSGQMVLRANELLQTRPQDAWVIGHTLILDAWQSVKHTPKELNQFTRIRQGKLTIPGAIKGMIVSMLILSFTLFMGYTFVGVKPINNPTNVVGVVTMVEEHEHSSRRHGRTETCSLEYQYLVNNDVYSMKTNIQTDDYCDYNIGDQIKIVYDKNDPQDHYINLGAFKITKNIVIFSLFAFIPIIAVLAFTISLYALYKENKTGKTILKNAMSSNMTYSGCSKEEIRKAVEEYTSTFFDPVAVDRIQSQTKGKKYYEQF